MNRITDSILDARVATINSLLGHGTDPERGTNGSIVLHKAYGSTAVRQYSGTGMGEATLSDLGTKREAYIFLSGMIAAVRALDTTF